MTDRHPSYSQYTNMYPLTLIFIYLPTYLFIYLSIYLPQAVCVEVAKRWVRPPLWASDPPLAGYKPPPEVFGWRMMGHKCTWCNEKATYCATCQRLTEIEQEEAKKPSAVNLVVNQKDLEKKAKKEAKRQANIAAAALERRLRDDQPTPGGFLPK